MKRVIFLSAQPDEYYFLWQLKVQLFNLSLLGVLKGNIHVLIAYDKNKGLNPCFNSFVDNNKFANVFLYCDERRNLNYLSSVRPHIIRKHFNAHPHLKSESIFYHDSDVIFKELPRFDMLVGEDVWWVSNAKSYLDSKYIISIIGEEGFTKMCAVIGIEPGIVRMSDGNAGGAQYYINNCEAEFWGKVERDSERLFEFLEGYNIKINEGGKYRTSPTIQSWCADMWALWWNALLVKKEIRIHKELDFVWANTPIHFLNDAKILHYTGDINKDQKWIFRKNDYVHSAPFYDDNLFNVDRRTCSFFLREELTRYIEMEKGNRAWLQDLTFLMVVRIDSEERLENFYITIKYLSKWFNTKIEVIEASEEKSIELERLPKETKYYFRLDRYPKLNRAKYFNELLAGVSTPFIALHDVDVIIPAEQVNRSLTKLREEQCSMVFPYDGTFICVDPLSKAIFSKVLDPLFFENNIGKFSPVSHRSFGGSVFLRRKDFIEAGKENENIKGWGPDDVERVKRMEILGYKVLRIAGNIYHLPHPRTKSSGYSNVKERCDMLEEYFRVCGMRRDELYAYVRTWS